jgi:hypothetical protein
MVAGEVAGGAPFAAAHQKLVLHEYEWWDRWTCLEDAMLTTTRERINCDFCWVTLTTYANMYIAHRDCVLLEIEYLRN